ncbi:MAG TPA: DUF3159 domain-containing protein [Pseudonocardiaceae bacterium]
MQSAASPPADVQRESLAQLLGGRRGALDATLPPVVFVATWLITGRSVALASGAALLSGALVAIVRWRLGGRPRAVLLGLLGVAVAAVVAVRTGRAADFFVVQLAVNAASALAWAVSIVIRWPLLGVVVGTVLGQRTRWRRDPDLLRGYSIASWAWVAQYLIRVVVFGSLYWASFYWDGAVVALGVARVALSWPLVAACLAVSWWLLRRCLPADHPGLRRVRPVDIGGGGGAAGG